MVDLCFLKFTRHGRQLLPSPALIRNCNDREQLQESLIRAFDASKSILCISLEWVVEFTLGETTAFVPFVPDVVTEIANLIQQPDNEVFYTKNVNLSEDERSITIEVPIWWNSEGPFTIAAQPPQPTSSSLKRSRTDKSVIHEVMRQNAYKYCSRRVYEHNGSTWWVFHKLTENGFWKAGFAKAVMATYDSICKGQSDPALRRYVYEKLRRFISESSQDVIAKAQGLKKKKTNGEWVEKITDHYYNRINKPTAESWERKFGGFQARGPCAMPQNWHRTKAYLLDKTSFRVSDADIIVMDSRESNEEDSNLDDLRNDSDEDSEVADSEEEEEEAANDNESECEEEEQEVRRSSRFQR